MARIRSIHPGLFSDPEFADLSDAAQMFYLGLLTEADDNGIFEWKPTTLRIRLRPTKDGSVDGLLSELVKAEKVSAYEINGRKYGAIRNFRRFQRPKSPKAWHPILDDFRNYVGLTSATSEQPPPQPRAFPQKREIVPQMEEEGGRRKEESEPIGSGAIAPSDPVKVLFDSGVKLLTENGCKPSNARSIIGKWRSEHGDEATQAAIKAAQAEGVTEPIAWITQRFANKPRESWRERQLRADEALIEKALQ